MSLPSNSSCLDFLKSAVREIPSLFGRLSCVASRLDPRNGLYSYPAAAKTCEPHEMDRILRQQHVEIFEAWLCLTLQEQASDLAAYFEEDHHQRETVRQWTAQSSYMTLVPGSALGTQQKLFRLDMEMILRVFYSNT
ncbi:MAG: hypothetical protein ACLP59_27915 [Bryobacteraceae bacterium]